MCRCERVCVGGYDCLYFDIFGLWSFCFRVLLSLLIVEISVVLVPALRLINVLGV